MICAKNYETLCTFVEVMQKKTVASFFPDTVYNHNNRPKLVVKFDLKFCSV